LCAVVPAESSRSALQLERERPSAFGLCQCVPHHPHDEDEKAHHCRVAERARRDAREVFRIGRRMRLQDASGGTAAG